MAALGEKRAPRSEKENPARVMLTTGIARDLDRELRAWSCMDDVSIASIVELALRREFRERRVYRTTKDNNEASRLVELQIKGRKLKA